MDIKAVRYGCISYLCVCQDCDWQHEGYLDRPLARRLARQHVRETGHTVVIQYVRDTICKPEE